MSVCCPLPVYRAVLSPTTLSPTDLCPAARPSGLAHAVGRHRRPESIGARIGRSVDLLARLGTAVSLAALLVVAGAAAGLVTGTPSDDIPTMTVTFDHAGR